jgi:hypothetical protein
MSFLQVAEIAHKGHGVVDHGQAYLDATADADAAIAHEHTRLLAQGVNADPVEATLITRAAQNRRRAWWLCVVPIILLAPAIAFVVVFTQDTTSTIYLSLMVTTLVLWTLAIIVPCVWLRRETYRTHFRSRSTHGHLRASVTCSVNWRAVQTAKLAWLHHNK